MYNIINIILINYYTHVQRSFIEFCISNKRDIAFTPYGVCDGWCKGRRKKPIDKQCVLVI